MPDPSPHNRQPQRDPAPATQPPAPFPAIAWETLLTEHQSKTGLAIEPRMQAALEALKSDLPFLENSRKEPISRLSSILLQALENIANSSAWTIEPDYANAAPLVANSAAERAEKSFSELLLRGVDFKATDRGAKLLLDLLDRQLLTFSGTGYDSPAGRHLLTQFLFLAANGGFPVECESILTAFYMTSVERSRISTYLNESPKEAGVNKAYAKLCEILADRV